MIQRGSKRRAVGKALLSISKLHVHCTNCTSFASCDTQSAFQKPNCNCLMRSTRQCAEEGCIKRPSFGVIEEKQRYCSVHKRAGDQDLAHRNRCEHAVSARLDNVIYSITVS